MCHQIFTIDDDVWRGAYIVDMSIYSGEVLKQNVSVAGEVVI